eukprot:GSA25T00022272001.1
MKNKLSYISSSNQLFVPSSCTSTSTVPPDEEAEFIVAASDMEDSATSSPGFTQRISGSSVVIEAAAATPATPQTANQMQSEKDGLGLLQAILKEYRQKEL